MQADRDGQAAAFAEAYEASEMRSRVQQELKAAGATAGVYERVAVKVVMGTLLGASAS